MIRVLQCVNNMHRAGLETMLMNYYRRIDRTKIQFDFLTHRPERSDYDDEIETLGGKIYRAPRLYPQNYPAYFRWMKGFFAEHPEYKIVHSHIDAMSLFPLLAAKRAGVPVRIAHSHSTSIDRDAKYLLKQIFRLNLSKAANFRCACGEKAGEFLFRSKDFTQIPNAIDAQLYRFDPGIRDEIRREMGIQHAFAIGHVGRFSYPKNHEFLIDAFAEVLKRQGDSVLLLVGTGEKLDRIRAYAREKAVDQKVLFLGNRSDVHKLYQAFDAFVMPSLFEGVPMVGIEAQFAALPCVFSDRVPREVAFSGACSFFSLDRGAAAWADQILSLRGSARETEIANPDFDIRHACKGLEDYYLNLSLSLK